MSSGARYLVPIESLQAADSPRSNGEDRQHIARLAESESELPPILVHRATMRVIDGMHRLRAAISKGQHEIEVVFFDGTQAQAFLAGVELNTTHGLPLSLSDRKAAAERIVESMPAMSDRAIAAVTGLSAKTIAALRARSSAEVPQSNTRVGVDGRRRPVDRNQGRLRVEEVLATSPDLPLRALALAADVSVSTAHAARKRLLETRGRESDEDSSQSDTTAQLLQQLARDPAIRLTQHGRDLLRWLHTHAIQREVWTRLVDTVPVHCLPTVRELACRNAKEWRALASYVSTDSSVNPVPPKE